MKNILRLLLLTWIAAGLPRQAAAQTLQWAHEIGNGYIQSFSVAVDPVGNSYWTGAFSGTMDFDVGPGVFNLSASGSQDAFLLKLGPAGNFKWAKRVGGTGQDRAASVALDGANHVYFGGQFKATADLDPGPGTFNATSLGLSDVFVTQLDTAGNFIWAKTVGSIEEDAIQRIAADSLGNVYVPGATSGHPDYDPGPGTYFIPDAGTGFLLKLDSNGQLDWAVGFGGDSVHCMVYQLQLDPAGNSYVVGIFGESGDFAPGPATDSLFSAGGHDNFMLKLNPSGQLIWARSIGGSGYDYAPSLALDRHGNTITGGNFLGTMDLDPGSGVQNHTALGALDSYLLKLDSAGNFVWGKSFGSTTHDVVFALGVDRLGNVYSAGLFTGTTDLDPGPGVSNFVCAGYQDMFVQKFDAAGNLLHAAAFGGTGNDVAEGLAVSNDASVFVTGFFVGPVDFDPGAGVTNLGAPSTNNLAVLKMGFCTPSAATISPVACGAYLSPSGEHVWNVTGTYTDLIANATGCDSLLTIHLTVIPSSFAGFSFASNGTTATFTDLSQGANAWIWDFGDGNTSTSQNPAHTYAAAGTYNVCLIATASGCSDTICQGVTVLQVDVATGSSWKVAVFPNPSQGAFQVQMDRRLEGEVIDAQGRIILARSFEPGRTLLDLSGAADGIYLLRLKDGDSQQHLRLAKFGE